MPDALRSALVLGATGAVGRHCLDGLLESPLYGRVVSIGRLDLTSEGLLLLTNDGELARRLELPANAWIRRSAPAQSRSRYLDSAASHIVHHSSVA